jgi:hypothetical protein
VNPHLCVADGYREVGCRGFGCRVVGVDQRDVFDAMPDRVREYLNVVIDVATPQSGWFTCAERGSGIAVAPPCRLKTIACGGTPLDEAAASRLLRDAALISVRSLPPPGAPAITIGQKPA